MRRSLWSLVVAMPLVALLWFGLQRNPDAQGEPLLNKPAPSFTLTSLRGRDVSLAALRGRPVVLNFWASWCASCKIEHPFLLQLARTYGPRGVAFLAISYQDSARSDRAFLRRYGSAWQALLDPGDRAAFDYGISRVPETYVIDRRGVIRFHSPGAVIPGTSVTPGQVGHTLSALLREHA